MARTQNAAIHAATHPRSGSITYAVDRWVAKEVPSLSEAERLASDLADAVLLGPGDVVIIGRADPNGAPYRFDVGCVEAPDGRFSDAPDIRPGILLFADVEEHLSDDLAECVRAFTAYATGGSAETTDPISDAGGPGDATVDEPWDERRWVCGAGRSDLVWRDGAVVLRWEYRPAPPGNDAAWRRRTVLVADCRTAAEAHERFLACVATLDRQVHGFPGDEGAIGSVGVGPDEYVT